MRSLIVLLLLACDTRTDTADACRAEDDPAVTLYYNIELCPLVDYECAEYERSFVDDCGCGCAQP